MQRSYSSHVCFFGTGKTQRVDLVWDVYTKGSLKLSTMANREQEHTKEYLAMPSFQGTRKTNFLRNDDNKHELYLFLGQ